MGKGLTVVQFVDKLCDLKKRNENNAILISYCLRHFGFCLKYKDAIEVEIKSRIDRENLIKEEELSGSIDCGV